MSDDLIPAGLDGPLSVLIVNPMGGEGWGGVERWLMDVARGLAERGHRIHAAGRPGSRWLRRIAARGFEGIEVPLRADFHLGQARKLSRFMQERGVDVVLTKLHRGIRVSGFAAKLAGAPPVVAFMGLVETRPGLRYRLTYELFLDRVVTLSDRMKDAIVERGALDPETVEAIPYGVVLDSFKAPERARQELREEFGIPAGAPVALGLGRLNMQKRFDVLLETFRTVLERVPDAHLVIAGTGKLKSDLLEHRERMGLTQRAHLVGFRSDIPRVLAAVDCMVLSSDDEGLPHVILEAMAARLPVVSTNVGSIDEQVVHGETGLLVPRRDPAALAAALSDVLGDRERMAAMGAAAHARVAERFPLDLCIDRTERYLLGLRASSGRRNRVGH